MGTVFFVPSTIEPAFWLVIFLICAVIVAKRAPGRFFLHGLCISLVNSVWITAAHVLLFDRYIAGHTREAAMFANAPLPLRPMMLVMGPLFGLASGLVLGLFCFVASKILKRPQAA